MEFLQKISKFTQWINGTIYVPTTNFGYHTATCGLSDAELCDLKELIYKFEKKIDKDKFRKTILTITEKVCEFFGLTNVINIDNLAESAYDDYLIRLHQIVKHIHRNPYATMYSVSNSLKFDTIPISDFYPFIKQFIDIAENVSIYKRSKFQDQARKDLSKTIHEILYSFAVETRNKILEHKAKEQETEKQHNKTVNNETVNNVKEKNNDTEKIESHRQFNDQRNSLDSHQSEQIVNMTNEQIDAEVDKILEEAKSSENSYADTVRLYKDKYTDKHIYEENQLLKNNDLSDSDGLSDDIGVPDETANDEAYARKIEEEEEEKCASWMTDNFC